jgi:hypothetical protein
MNGYTQTNFEDLPRRRSRVQQPITAFQEVEENEERESGSVYLPSSAIDSLGIHEQNEADFMQSSPYQTPATPRIYRNSQAAFKSCAIELGWLKGDNRKKCRETLRNTEFLPDKPDCFDCDFDRQGQYICYTCAPHVTQCRGCIVKKHYHMPCHHWKRISDTGLHLTRVDLDQDQPIEEKPLFSNSEFDCKCKSRSTRDIRFIGLDGVEKRRIYSCHCSTDAQKVIMFGYWPCAAEKFGSAISIQMLQFYRLLNRHGFISMQAFATSAYESFGGKETAKLSSDRFYKLFNQAYIEYR